MFNKISAMLQIMTQYANKYRRKGAFLGLCLGVTPLQLLIWRSIWHFLTLYIETMPDDTLSSWFSADVVNGMVVFSVGFVLRCCMEVSQHELGDVIEQMERRIGHGPLARAVTMPITYVYISINILISLCMWCGTWWLLDSATQTICHVGGDEENTSLSVACIHVGAMLLSLAFLWSMKATISLCAGPLAISSDNKDHVFGAATLYDSRLTNSSYRFFVRDQILSMSVHLTVVLCWWSIWRVADHVEEYVHDKNLSVWTGGERTEIYHWGDLFVGTVLTCLAYAAQFPLKTMAVFRLQDSWHYKACHYATVLVGALGSLLSWRGWWVGLDTALPKYVFRGYSENTDYGVSTLMAVAMLVVLGCLNTTTCRGVGIRIERDSDEFLFDLEYVHPWRNCASDIANYHNLDSIWQNTSHNDEERPVPVSPTTDRISSHLTDTREGTLLLSTREIDH